MSADEATTEDASSTELLDKVRQMSNTERRLLLAYLCGRAPEAVAAAIESVSRRLS